MVIYKYGLITTVIEVIYKRIDNSTYSGNDWTNKGLISLLVILPKVQSYN